MFDKYFDSKDTPEVPATPKTPEKPAPIAKVEEVVPKTTDHEQAIKSWKTGEKLILNNVCLHQLTADSYFCDPIKQNLRVCIHVSRTAACTSGRHEVRKLFTSTKWPEIAALKFWLEATGMSTPTQRRIA